MNADEYADVATVAGLLKLRPRTVHNMARARALPGAFRIAREWHFHLPTLRAYLDATTLKEPAPVRRPDATPAAVAAGLREWAEGTGQSVEEVTAHALAFAVDVYRECWALSPVAGGPRDDGDDHA